MQTNIKVRIGNDRDFEGIFLLIREFSIFQKTPEKLTISLEQMLAEKDLFQCFVAETMDAEIVGFASFFFAYYSWSGKALYLDDLYVKENFRGQKIGGTLLNAVIDYAKKENCKKLRWQVSGWNTNGIDFYKKIGAVIDGTEINCDLQLTSD